MPSSGRLQEQDIAFENHEVRVTIDGKPKVYRLNARKLDSSDQDNQTILLAFEDVTEELRVERAVARSCPHGGGRATGRGRGARDQ